MFQRQDSHMKLLEKKNYEQVSRKYRAVHCSHTLQCVNCCWHTPVFKATGMRAIENNSKGEGIRNTTHPHLGEGEINTV